MRALVVLVLILVAHALVFGLRSWLHRRRTGSWGFLGTSGKPFSSAWFGGALFVAAILLSFAAPLLVGVDPPRLPPFDVAGGLLVALGIAGTAWSQAAMGVSWRIGVRDSERTALVTAGPFARVRNPVFSFMGLTLIGALLLLPTVTMLAAFLAYLVAVELQVRVVEEPYLARVHGEAYAAYMKRAGRFLPRLSGRTSSG